MKKILITVICIALLLSLTSCGNNEERTQAVTAMFDCFDKSEDIILLTCFELVVNGRHYDLSDIKYSGQRCNIVFLEENGFYSYIYDPARLSVEFLYSRYDTFETTSLGTTTLPAEIINAFWQDQCFYFRIDDPSTDEFQQMYYSWCIDTKQVTIVDHDSISHDSEYSVDNNRSTKYSFAFISTLFNDYLAITDTESGITKTVDPSILSTFDEGNKISHADRYTAFNIQHAFDHNGTIYFTSLFAVNPLGDPCYCYVYSWNFETEECEFYTAVPFDSYQEWVTDMYIN